MTGDPSGPLTDAELRDFLRLLARYAEHELDQFATWLVPTAHGPAYLAMTRKLWPGWPEEAFAPIRPPRSQVRDGAEEQEAGGSGS